VVARGLGHHGTIADTERTESIERRNDNSEGDVTSRMHIFNVLCPFTPITHTNLTCK
jgi:hypothetical protein